MERGDEGGRPDALSSRARSAEPTSDHRLRTGGVVTTLRRSPDVPDVVVIGRICIDIYPEQIGVVLPEVRTFSKSIGGSATNVAVAIAQLGNSARLITRTGDDPFGEFARAELGRLGVATEGITPAPGMQSVLTFCEIYPPDDFPLYIYRNPTAPDMYVEEGDLPLDL